MPSEAPERPSHAPPRHRRALLVATAIVALAHVLLIGALPLGAGAAWGGAVQRTVQVGQIVLVAPVEPGPAAASPAPPPPAPPPAPAPKPATRPKPLPAAAPAAEPAIAAVVPEAAASASEPDTVVALAEAASAPPAAPSAAAPAAAVNDGKPLPVYRTRPPPSARLHYELRHGALRGSGELNWAVEGGRYRIGLEGSAFGLSLISQQSEGGFDGAGLAPERFVDKRRGRSGQAANFRRAEGRITFSGPPVEYPIIAGAQDRVSFMLQLAAIVGADPRRFGPGSEITMFVVGARGDGDVWNFEVEAVETLDVPAGHVVGALRLQRQPRRPFDQLVEVWLDPARSWLPVRLRQSTPQTGESNELLLSDGPPR